MATDQTAHATRPTPLPATAHARPSRRAWLLLALAVVVLALLILPPYLSVSRFQRRITTSMSQALGRPVHLDHVTLHLLPIPSFTIDNLVIDELPPFGAEPIIRANTVSARLRLSSVWRRRVEFSRITFTDPSINLVRNPDGRWNLESFLLQAAHINAAPTTAPRPGSAPRFPYIEATGARINLKLAQRKTPFSLTEVELALWLPEPQQWKLRLRGRPARTDTGATDTGLLQTEATLERAGSVGQVPLTLDASWTDAPLGEASRVLTGTDAGLRGELSLTTHIAGTLDNAAVKLELKLGSLRRADLVPDRLVDIDVRCHAGATRLLHTLSDLHCTWPLAESTRTELLHPGTAATAQLTLAGSVPDVLAPRSAQLGLTAEHVSAQTLLTWARATTGNLAPGLEATGELNGTATWPGIADPATAELNLTHLSLTGGRLGSTPVTFAGTTLLGSTPNPGTFAGATLELAPVAVAFGRQGSQQTSAAAAPGILPDHTPPPDTTPSDPPVTPAVSDSTLSVAAETADAQSSPTRRSGLPAGQSSPNEVDPAATDSTAAGTTNPGSTTAARSTVPGPGALAGGTAILSGTATTDGYSAHLTGLVPLPRLLALGSDVPSFGANLAPTLPTNRAAGPTRVDLSVHRLWGAPPIWTNNLLQNGSAPALRTSPTAPRHKPSHHRR